MYALEFEIRGLPTLVNRMSRAHWAIAYREGKNWKKYVWVVTRGKCPPKPLQRARVEFTRFSHGRGVDCDNLAISFKAIRDALVECCILVNDAPENIEAIYLWKRIAPSQGKIKVIIHEIPLFLD